jgi:ElaB/YqjD/DUF883 family membrane-anchored ribosome-binding protein
MDNNESGDARLVADFKKIVTDTEALLRSVAGVAGEQGAAMQASLAETLESAKAELRKLQQATTQRAGEAARATDAYVHENPWQAVAVAGAVGLIAGLIVGRRR